MKFGVESLRWQRLILRCSARTRTLSRRARFLRNSCADLRKYGRPHEDRKLLEIAGPKVLLDRNPVLARSIQLRNPYVDPLSLDPGVAGAAQALQEDGNELNYALAATMNGIAAGLHNTG